MKRQFCQEQNADGASGVLREILRRIERSFWEGWCSSRRRWRRATLEERWIFQMYSDHCDQHCIDSSQKDIFCWHEPFISFHHRPICHLAREAHRPPWASLLKWTRWVQGKPWDGIFCAEDCISFIPVQLHSHEVLLPRWTNWHQTRSLLRRRRSTSPRYIHPLPP